MAIFKAYVSDTGFIKGIFKIVNDNTNAGGITIEGLALGEEILMDLTSYQAENYYDYTTETFLERPASTASISKTTITADATDSVMISGIPADGTLLIDNVEYPVEEDGTQEFGTGLLGVYKVSVIAFPYLDATWEVTAT